MPLPIPPAVRSKILGPTAPLKDPADPIGEDDEDEALEMEKKGGKPNPLKRWAESKLGAQQPPVPPTTGVR